MRKWKWALAGLGAVAMGSAVAYAQYSDTEEPAHEVLKSEDLFELRDYEPMIVAEVTVTGDRRSARGQGFRRLAAYIFAQDRPDGGEKIAMTAPVMQDRPAQDEQIAMTAPVMADSPEAGVWRTRFVMPGKYTLDTLPTAPEDITLTTVPGRRMAVITFSGNAPQRDLELAESQLRAWIAAQELEITGGVEHAFYDAPMVPGRFRRNEVMIPVSAE